MVPMQFPDNPGYILDKSRIYQGYIHAFSSNFGENGIQHSTSSFSMIITVNNISIYYYYSLDLGLFKNVLLFKIKKKTVRKLQTKLRQLFCHFCGI